MSALGAGIGKAVGSLGGPQVAAIVVAGGLVAGAIGGGILGGGGIRQARDLVGVAVDLPLPRLGSRARLGGLRPEVPRDRQERRRELGPDLLPAAGPHRGLGDLRAAQGRRLAERRPGRALLTGGGWPGGVDRARLVADGDRGQQPVAGAAASDEPSSSPENGAPSLARLASTPGTIAGGPQRYCANTARSVTVSVRVTDTERIASVVLSYRRPGSSSYATKPMARGGGTNTWQATLRTDTDGIDTAGDLRFFVTATDANTSPRSARLPADGSRSITVAGCANQGPTLASVKANPGPVFTNLRACANNTPVTTVSAAATDVDGVTG